MSYSTHPLAFDSYPPEIQEVARREFRKRNEVCKRIYGTTAREMGLTLEVIAHEFFQQPELMATEQGWTRDTIREGLYAQSYTQYASPAIKPGESGQGHRHETW